MKIVAILQARFGSTRLPGKVLMPLHDSTVLGQVSVRVRRASRLNETWIATSVAASDDAVATEAARLGLPCFRGDLNDVLGRYHAAAQAAQADVVVRVTCDCPLFDGHLLDAMLEIFARESARQPIDYFSNVIQRTFPRGLDAEIVTRPALDRAFHEARRAYEREHVTPYFYNHPGLFSLYSYTGSPDLSGHRWTLDTPEDWAFVREIYAASPSLVFTTADVLALLARRPDLQLLNRHVPQKTDPSAAAH